ncbi:hypothetical protein ACFL0A_00485 [Patescibacteria group bacterium]
MQNESSNRFFSKDVLKALVIAIIVVALGEVILVWQYQRLEEKRIPLIEEKIEKQQEEMEQKSAKDALDKFISARIDKNEDQANFCLTEGAMDQKMQNEFILVNNFKSYEILKTEKLKEGRFQFLIKLYEKGEMGEIVEVIILTKIIDQYYVDSIEMAG